MNDLERIVWGSAFAAEFAAERKFMKDKGHMGSHISIHNISGFSCGEIADIALEMYREAVQGPDREYLIPVKEGECD